MRRCASARGCGCPPARRRARSTSCSCRPWTSSACAPHARKPISRLSGGQRKRVSVGVELLAKPAILFLDEPSSGLDPATEFQLMELLRDLADTGCTIVCTTHVMENAYLMDQLIVLVGGCLAFQGSAQAAREYFGVPKLTGLYDRLADRPPKEWQTAFLERPRPPRRRRAATPQLAARRQPRAPRPRPAHPARAPVGHPALRLAELRAARRPAAGHRRARLLGQRRSRAHHVLRLPRHALVWLQQRRAGDRERARHLPARAPRRRRRALLSREQIHFPHRRHHRAGAAHVRRAC